MGWRGVGGVFGRAVAVERIKANWSYKTEEEVRDHTPELTMQFRQKQPRLRLNPAEYDSLRKQVLDRDGWKCQDCGSSNDLHVHHLRPRSKLGHDAPENLITLCSSCHRRQHWR